MAFDTRLGVMATKILRVLEPENGGPRNRNVLEGLAGDDGQVLDELIARGLVVMTGEKRGAMYELAMRCAKCGHVYAGRLGKYGCPNCG